MKLKIITAGFIAFALSGCVQPSETASTNTNTSPVETENVKKNDIVFNYSANGKIYRIHSRYDRILRAYGTTVSVVSGGPAFTGSNSEDAEAQNTIRDAFRSQGICKDGLHPGLITFGYGYSAEFRQWSARVRCTDKIQANI